jgi:hypothetical protein
MEHIRVGFKDLYHFGFALFLFVIATYSQINSLKHQFLEGKYSKICKQISEMSLKGTLGSCWNTNNSIAK